MSRDQGDQTLKNNEDILTDSPDTGENRNLSQIESSDHVDHSVGPKSKYDQKEPLKEGLDTISAKSNTDSGFKDPGAGPTEKTDFDTSSDDEDLHLKWEDDETEEQEPMPNKKGDKNVSEILDSEEGVTDKVLDENLESSEEADKVDVSVDPKEKPEDLQEPETSVVDDKDKLLKCDDDNITDESKTTKSKPEIFNTNILKTTDSSDKIQKSVYSNENEDSIDQETLNTAPVKEIKENITGNVSGKETTNVLSTDAHNKDESVINDNIIATSSPNESFSNTTIDAISDHRLNKPDVMLEIPTLEVIDILDDTDISIANTDDTNMVTSLKSQQIEVAKVDAIDVSNKTIGTVQLQSKKEQIIELNSAIFEVDLKDQDQTVQTSTVSEDDWSEIERKLIGFETSLVEDSESKVKVIEDSGSKIDSTKTESIKSPNAKSLKSKELENSLKDGSKTEINLQPNESTLPKPASPVHKPTLKLRDIGSLLAKPITTSADIINIDESSLTELQEALDKSIDLISEDSNDKTISDKFDSISLKAQSSEEMLIESMTDVNIQPKIDSHLTEDFKMDVDEEPSNSEVDVEKTATLFDTAIKIDDSTKSLLKMNVDTENIEPTIQSSSQQLENLIISEANEVPTTVTSSTNEPLTLEVTTTKVQPSTSKTVIAKPSSSKADDVQPSTSGLQTEVQPSTSAEGSQLAPDSSDEVPEVTDSLGLLAESSRVMEDDEEQEDEDDDDDDFYQEDESSNQISAEHSEDSNAQQSETDMKEQEGKETDTESPQVEKEQFSFDVGETTTVTEKDGVLKEKDGEIDVDEAVCEDDVVTDTIADVTSTEQDVVAERGKEKKSDEEVKAEQPKQDIETDAEDIPAAKNICTQDTSKTEKSEADKCLPSKKLEYSKPGKVLNYVDLEESSEDEIQEVKKDVPTAEPDNGTAVTVEGGHVVIPSDVEVKVSEPEDKQNDSTPQKEVAAETPSTTDTPLDETKASEDTSKAKHKFSLEVFSLDSDEEDAAPQPPKEKETDKTKENNKCINLSCTSTTTVYYTADPSTVSFYDAEKKRRDMVCEECAEVVVRRAKSLVEGVREMTPLLDLDPGRAPSELVEISDSDSDTGELSASRACRACRARRALGPRAARFIEKELTKTLNETWVKYNLDSRLTEAQDELQKEMSKLEEETKEIDVLLSECQVATDQLRNELYATFEQDRLELNGLTIHDTPTNKYMCLESAVQSATEDSLPETRAKRRLSSASEIAPKRAAIPLGYTPLDSDKTASQESKNEPTVETTKADDDKDIAVLKVSVEAAPSDLPPPGEVTRPPLKVDMQLYAMRNTFGSWAKAKVLEVQGKGQVPGASQNFTICRVKLFSRSAAKTKLLPARCLAYFSPAPVRMTIGTRVIALFKDPMNDVKRDTFYSGIIAEVPNPVNSYRYLVFFDDGYAQYVRHRDTRLVCECSPLVWEEVHPFSREFVRKYLIAYPERPMVRLHAGQSLKTEWNGKWWPSRVISVDASLVQVHFEEDDRTEWIYRGSTRLAPLYLELQAAERHRARPMPRTKAQPRVNMPYVEYTRSDEQSKPDQQAMPPRTIAAQEREIRQRAVAKKSTAAPQQPPATHTESVTSRVVYYTPKNAIKPYNITPHTCGPHCRRKDTLALKDLRTYNPLAKPLLSGWERQIVRYNGHKEVMYRAPCGRRLRSMRELHRYLRVVQSDLPVDLFDFTPHTHCLAEFVLNKCLVGKKDLSHGKENVPVPCVNYYDESLPEFCSYNTERTPTAGVPLNLDPEFLCGCDCTDDCEDKSKCACWKMTLEGARTIGLVGKNVGYVYKRLPEPLPSGIYECNSRCKCKQTCLNRVAQHPLQLKLQVFKTLNRGWGIRALNDVPKGSFLCVYAGNLLTDATANMDGLNEGDEYLAELDYIEVVEQMKEGYEEDIPEHDKKLDKVLKRDKKQKHNTTSEDPDMSSSDEEEPVSKNEQEDGDFCPGFIGMGVTEFSKRLRKRDKGKKEKEEPSVKEKEEKPDEDCITISDDEEVREPARFMAQAGMESSEFVSKYKSVRSLFGKDEACYIMDAKVQGNIGRYLNHSCMPNVFVQNVFVDTHDPRFPWVAFFALSHIKAGTELTWNYNYDVGSVPGKTLYCYCGAPNCRGRLL